MSEDAKHVGVTGLEASLSLWSLDSLDTELPTRLGGDSLLHSDDVKELRLALMSVIGVRCGVLGIDDADCSRVLRLILRGGGINSSKFGRSQSAM